MFEKKVSLYFFDRALYGESNAFNLIQRTTCTNRENTFPDPNRIHPKYVCTRARENSRSPRSSIFNPDCVCRLFDLAPWTPVTQCSLYFHLCLFHLFFLSLFCSFSRTRTAFWQCVPARLDEGLLAVRAKISVRKFRSVAASESAAKLDINLPRYPGAILYSLVSPLWSFRLSSYVRIVH